MHHREGGVASGWKMAFKGKENPLLDEVGIFRDSLVIDLKYITN